MDLLAKRWANPFLMLDEFVRLNQLHEALNEVFKLIADERKENLRWEYYLHKVCHSSDMTFEEYVHLCEGHLGVDSEEMTDEQIGSVISESRSILDAFK